MKRIFFFCCCLLFSISLYSQRSITLRGNILLDSGENLPTKVLYIYGLLPNGDALKTTVSDNLTYKVTTSTTKTGRVSIVYRLGKSYSFMVDLSISSDSVIYQNVDFRSERNRVLSQVEVNTKKKNTKLSQRFMRDIEGSMVLAGKKTQVEILDNMLINKSNNTARQMFRDISGITIQEGSESGLQLNVGSRGLNPNRSANFSVRQNGYDIAADPLGYPESYYTPNANDVSEIQVIRGASALQYGSQFGGMINFKLSNASRSVLSLRESLNYGSYNALNNYTRLSGTIGKTSYYLSGTYKRGDGYRPNSDYKGYNILAQLSQRIEEDSKLSVNLLKFHYLEHQPGGLTDLMYNENPLQSNRERNWFLIDWNILALNFHSVIPSIKTDIDINAMGLYAKRYALGFRDKRVSTQDPLTSLRDLQKGTFRNWSIETRALKRFYFTKAPSTLLVGLKYYQSDNSSRQGMGDSTRLPHFDIIPIRGNNNLNIGKNIDASYKFPNLNLALFSEFVIRLSDKFSVIPGIRWEYIKTSVDGSITDIERQQNFINSPTIRRDSRSFSRFVFLPGVAISYKANKYLELYGNACRNYRAITFNDLKTITPNFKVNDNIKDEHGYSFDLGIRGKHFYGLNYDISGFALYYGDRIGEYFRKSNDYIGYIERYRDNIGDALSYGLESSFSYPLSSAFSSFNRYDLDVNLYFNSAITFSKYIHSQEKSIIGNSLEFVPLYNLRGGFEFHYKDLSLSYQASFTSFQYTDAHNEPMNPRDASFGIYGAIPGYLVMDCNASYKVYKGVSINLSLQNLTDEIYITRRASGYPGPGIIPSAPFNFNIGASVDLDVL